jgi:hypothetical protein
MSTDPLSYRGPDSEYKSYLDDSGSYVRNPTTSEKVGLGYADIDFLLSELETLSERTKFFYDTCVAEMQAYTLKLDTSDEVLIKSHQMSYPDDDTPDSISFLEYIYNSSESMSTSSSYVNRYYENKVRGIYGTNALDVAHVIRVMYSEVIRIINFLEKYTGEIDDPSEFRTIEAFQNWTQDAKNLLEGYEVAYQAKGLSGIPGEELAQIDETKSREFQALFQSKLNIINASIGDLISQLYKDWDYPSDQFYDKVLGPSLKFSLKVSRSITSGLNKETAPLLFQEADMTRLGLQSQFQSALNDQVKRNQLFYTYLEGILQNMIQRDTYLKYLDQLSIKGKVIPNPFITQIADEPAALTITDSLLGERTLVSFDSNASSGHNNLTDREDPTAHPQYVLKTGDVLSGDLDIYGELKLYGFGLSEIFEEGEDGSLSIRPGTIDWANLSSSDLAGSGDTSIPTNLSVSSKRELSDGKFEYTIVFEIEDGSVTSYEFEVVEL